MIGQPFNDAQCMGAITEVAAELVASRDPVIAGALALAGAGLAWKGEGEVVRNVGSSVMSAAGAQFGLLMLDKKKPPPVQVAKRNAGDFDHGLMLAALERARMKAMFESEGYAQAA